MFRLFTNNAETTLYSTLLIAEVSAEIPSGDAALFPDPSANIQYFMATLSDATDVEHVRVTVVTTGAPADTFTIVRAQEGSVAKEWPAGTKVQLRNTAAILQECSRYAAEIQSFETALGSGINAYNVSPETGLCGKLTLNDTNVTINLPASYDLPGADKLRLTILVQQGAGGSLTADWASSDGGTLYSPGGAFPTLTATADAIDVFTWVTIDGGVNWYLESYTQDLAAVSGGGY